MSARNIPADSPALSEDFSYFSLSSTLEDALPSADVIQSAPASFAPEAATTSRAAPELAMPVAAMGLDEIDPTRDSRFAGIAPTSQFSEAQPVPAKASLQRVADTNTKELRPKSRLALPIALPLVALVAIAYYFYRDSLQPNERQGAQVVSATGVPASAAQSASSGTSRIEAMGPAKIPATDDSAAATPNSLVGQGAAATSDSTGAGSKTPSTHESTRQVSTSNQESPAQQLLNKAEPPGGKRSGVTAEDGDVHGRAAPVAGNDATAKHSAKSRPMRTNQATSETASAQSQMGDGRAKIHPDSPRPCTEGVAALGLCSPNSTGAK